MKWPAYNLLFLSILCSCGGKSYDTSTLAAVVGDSELTLEEVRSNVPSGLSEADSLKFVDQYVNNWIEEQVISQEAESIIPDIEEIDRMVDAYRRQLVILRYRQLMESGDFIKKPDKAQVEEYFNNHIENFKASRPLVKGLYIKVPEQAKEIKEIKRLYKSREAEDLDSLERLTVSATSYDYFYDRWVDWGQIETKIPLSELDSEPDRFPLNNDNLELLNDGYWYLLIISDRVKTGETLPLEYAYDIIVDALERENAITGSRDLRQSLTQKALDEGKAKIFLSR